MTVVKFQNGDRIEDPDFVTKKREHVVIGKDDSKVSAPWSEIKRIREPYRDENTETQVMQA